MDVNGLPLRRAMMSVMQSSPANRERDATKECVASQRSGQFWIDTNDALPLESRRAAP
jgi:hypothetical protein